MALRRWCWRCTAACPPVLERLREEGYQLVGLEQTTGSELLTTCSLVPKMVLVVGNERTGLEPDVLAKLDRVVEIPMAGLPHSLNAATSAAVAIYEYCRQHPGTLADVASADGSTAGPA